jgi:hypothetical protein
VLLGVICGGDAPFLRGRTRSIGCVDRDEVRERRRGAGRLAEGSGLVPTPALATALWPGLSPLAAGPSPGGAARPYGQGPGLPATHARGAAEARRSRAAQRRRRRPDLGGAAPHTARRRQEAPRHGCTCRPTTTNGCEPCTGCTACANSLRSPSVSPRVTGLGRTSWPVSRILFPGALRRSVRRPSI